MPGWLDQRGLHRGGAHSRRVEHSVAALSLCGHGAKIPPVFYALISVRMLPKAPRWRPMRDRPHDDRRIWAAGGWGVVTCILQEPYSACRPLASTRGIPAVLRTVWARFTVNDP